MIVNRSYRWEILSVVVAACSVFLINGNPASAQAPVRKDIAIFDLAKPIDDPKNFNWFTPGTKREHGAHQAMWEPLFLLDYETGKLEPWLGVSLTPNVAQDVWTLTLRKDVKWSDGKAFTANDVKFTVDMVLKYDTLTAMEAATMRSQVESVTFNNAKPLEAIFKLRQANPRFALENFGGSLFGSFLIMPEHIWKDAIGKDPLSGKDRDPADFKFQNPIGTGPYKLKDPTKNSVTWIVDNNWWGVKGILNAFKKKLPDPPQLEWRVIDTEAKSKADLIGNNIDAAREFTLANFTDAKSQNAKIVGWDAASQLAWNDPCARQIDINTKREPWSNPKLRQALSFAIDRKALAAGVYGNTAVPSRSMFPEYGAMKPFIDAVVNAGFGLPPTADAAKAKALIEGLGYAKAGNFYTKDGQTLSAVITVNAGLPNDVEAAKAIAQQLVTVGIDASVQSVVNEQYWGSVVPKGDYEMVFGWLSCGSIAEPYASMARYATAAVPIGTRSPGFDNTGRWGLDPGPHPQKDYADVVMKEIKPLQLGQAGIPALVAKAYKFINDEMPFIPLVQSPRTIPFNTTYWTMWPAKGGSSVPMHSWGATHRLIHGLKKAP
jgi:peptide/nickel transport system substrate-binding protein